MSLKSFMMKLFCISDYFPCFLFIITVFLRKSTDILSLYNESSGIHLSFFIFLNFFFK